MSDVALPRDLNATTQRWFAISGVAAVPLMFLGLILARVVPAHNATWSAAHVVEVYSSHPDRIQLGCVLMMIGFAFWGWWTAVLSLWIRRTESTRYPVLTYSALILTTINTIVVELMALSFAVTGFRAGHIDPDITLTLNDVSWFLYYYTWPPYVLWLITIAIAILRDHSTPAIFPRWLAWFTLAQVVVILPNSLQTFSWAWQGPFAWDGFVTHYVVASIHGPWTFAMVYYVFKAITHDERGLTAPPVPIAPPA